MTALLRSIALLAIAGPLALGAAPALAEKPEWAGQGKGHGKGRDNGAGHAYFTDAQQRSVSGYYQRQFHRGHCPPGLAKKNNGCLPPGQAKKQWRVGQPLPAGVVIYDVPRSLVIKLGTPPAGQKYVRVAADILLIAVGTKMVVDAIEDLGRI